MVDLYFFYQSNYKHFQRPLCIVKSIIILIDHIYYITIFLGTWYLLKISFIFCIFYEYFTVPIFFFCLLFLNIVMLYSVNIPITYILDFCIEFMHWNEIYYIYYDICIIIHIAYIYAWLKLYLYIPNTIENHR